MNLRDRLAAMAGFPISPDEARDRRCCVRCEDEIDDDWSALDLREWELTQLCGSCFDRITEDPGE